MPSPSKSDKTDNSLHSAALNETENLEARSKGKAASQNGKVAVAEQNEESSETSRVVPVVPLRGMVAFPFMVLPLFVGREKSVRALESANEADKTLLLVTQRDEENEEPTPDDLFPIGTLAEIVQILKMPDGNVRVVAEGRQRVRVLDWQDSDAFLTARIEPIEETPVETTPETQALLRRLKNDFNNAVELSRNLPPEAAQNAQSQEELGALADMLASYLEIGAPQRQEILETIDAVERARRVASMLTQELQVLEVEKEIDSQVREGVSENQREYFLRERLKAIQEKLGDRDSSVKEADTLRERVQGLDMTDEARQKALSEIDRMEKMPPIAPEVGVIRTYVELLCDMPWNKRTEDNLDLLRAKEVLDADHYALEKIKDRILEFLAVRKLNPNSRGPILCFVGPPGVGKTSIGKSIAKALGREFIRVSVGGIHDEAEIRGHRRTYIGAMPGRLISAIRRVKTKNPVFMLDEIDKLGRDFRGDPSSALLEALDPEQNGAFSDHYLEVPFDLSEVMFVATGNLLDPIPAALRDRFEVLRFAGYTESEKLSIARQFLVTKQMKENGITDSNIQFTPDALPQLVRDYTREAGVRSLEREIGTVCRKVARKVAEKADVSTRKSKPKLEKITAKNLNDYLGPRKFIHGVALEKDEIGVSQGLAWTEVGGEIMPIEVSLVAGKGGVKLTGNLGNVMKESCEAAMTYARAHATKLGIDADWLSNHDAHIHVPSGAVPKDGPSAGVAISTALISALSARPVRKDVAMTGEISLRGRVLTVGGIKEKVLAAHRAGITTLIMPKENERDLEDIPAEVQSDLTFHFAEKLDDALKFALVAKADENSKENKKSAKSSTRKK